MRQSILSSTLAGTLLFVGMTMAQAATLQVTITADEYDGVCDQHCSLRDAIVEANLTPNADTIVLPAGTYGLTRLAALDASGVPIDDDDPTNGDIDVLGELLIRGKGTKTVVEGYLTPSGAFNNRLFDVHPGALLTLEKMTLQSGHTSHNGGAVQNHGQLTLSEVFAVKNRALERPLSSAEPYQRGQGGAIANYGQLTVLASRFQDNSVRSLGDNPAHGGALFNHLGRALIRDSLFLANDVRAGGHGGAIYNLNGHVTIERSSFLLHGDRTPSSSGTIYNDEGEVTLTNSTLSQNHIGALANIRRQPGALAKATLTNVTVTGSFMDGNHAVMNSGDLIVRNSIIAGNNDPFVKLGPANCMNFGEYHSYQATGLLLGDEPSNCSGDHFVSLRDTYFNVLTPRLTKLSETLWFHALPPGSPALDSGVGDCISQDQRGVARPQDGNGDGVAVCDLGAYELTSE